jgi:hypothetical protein
VNCLILELIFETAIDHGEVKPLRATVDQGTIILKPRVFREDSGRSEK